MLSCEHVTAASAGTGVGGWPPASRSLWTRAGPCLGAPTVGPRSSSCVCSATLRKRRQAWEGGGDDGRNSNKRTAVLTYVRDAQPEEVATFMAESPPTVVSAMKQTVANLVGTLPPQQFSVTVDTLAESLAMLMQTMLRTGYLLRSAQYQLDLELALQSAAASMALPTTAAPGHSRSLAAPSTNNHHLGCEAPAASPAPPAVEGWQHPDGEYAPGVQHVGVSGEVLRWHPTHGVERLPAQQYIQLLEAQVAALKQQHHQQPAPPPTGSLALPSGVGHAGGILPASYSPASGARAAPAAPVAAAAAGAPDLLAYVRSLDAASLAALGTAGPDVADAMAEFVSRLMGTSERDQLRGMTSEFSAVDLSKLLFWLLVVGWMLRTMEVRWDVEGGFGPAPPSPPSEPNGGGSGSWPGTSWLLPGR